MFNHAIDRSPLAVTIATLVATAATSLVCLGAALGPALA